MWASVANRLTKAALSLTSRFSLALIAFAATTHTKHLTAWHTIDGLFLVAVGLALCVRPQRISKLAGYFLVGVSPLCKQSFVFMAPLSLLLLGDWARVKYWLAAALPPVLYLVYLVSARALPDAILQLTANTQLLTVGFQSYLDIQIGFAALVGYVCCWTICKRRSADQRSAKFFAVAGLYYVPSLVTAASLWFGTLMNTSFILFGLLAGTTICLLINDSGFSTYRRVALLALLTAWSASLSEGYNSPALGSGPILVALTVIVFSTYKGDRILKLSLPVTALLIVFSFGVARARYIYRDQPAANLNKSLEGVLPGAKLIKTNTNTYEFMSDLRAALEIVQARQQQYAILTDVAAHWVKAKQENPLPAVWPIELNKPELQQRFIAAMEQQRGKTIFIVQKVEAATLANGFTPVRYTYRSELVRYARTHFTKICETAYFELYE